MPKICYKEHRFQKAALDVIEKADAILTEYANQGFTATLRTLYYQFVARGWIANNEREYKKLGSILSDARLAGLIDWEHMEDKTRNVEKNSHWETPADIMAAAAQSFQLDKWVGQPQYVEAWCEKSALMGVIDGTCKRNDIPHFACRGYVSQSEMWGAAQRIVRACEHGGDWRDPIILYLGDHDPSGLNMTDDITKRLTEFFEGDLGWDGNLEIRRLALNMDQVQQYNPPPNPTKITDSRAADYIRQFGHESWELDALSPPVLNGLIQDAIDDIRDDEKWQDLRDQEATHRRFLRDASKRWTEVTAFLENKSA